MHLAIFIKYANASAGLLNAGQLPSYAKIFKLKQKKVIPSLPLEIDFKLVYWLEFTARLGAYE